METTKVKTVKRNINFKRLDIQDEKSQVDKLGEESMPTSPEDFLMFYAGKMAYTFLKEKVRATNMLAGFKRHYKGIDSDTEEKLDNFYASFEKDFNKQKRNLIKLTDSHPLTKRLCQIKGFTSYQLAMIMSYIKDVNKFDTPSKLSVYAGVACVEGLPVTKGNLAKIKEIYYLQGKEFHGFNTALSGRLYIVVECLLKQKGYFYNMYKGIRERLITRCTNNNEIFKATAADQKASKGKMKKGRFYMKDRKNFSLESFTDKNAKRRIARTLLHLIWTEWRILRKLPLRNPYPIDYLGHNQYIRLSDVLTWEERNC